MDRIQKALDKAKERNTQQNVLVPKQAKFANKIDSPRRPDPLEQSAVEGITYSQTKVINIAPEALEEKRIVASLYNNPQSSVFRMLRTQILKKMRENNWQTIAITSPTAGEGKSLIASNLAVAIAMELNQTVLLVDMDLRNPSISDYFSLNVNLGLKDYLERDLSLPEVLVNPGIERLVILPGKGRAEDSAELLSGPKMTNLVSDIKSQYDSRLLIFDVPPLLQTDDVLLASKYFDCTLMVIEDGHNSEDSIVKSLQLLEGTNLLGTVLNKSERAPKHQNY
ncbi:MAG: exopolysaccharide biosynthesis protein [Methylophaga sp.]|nr:MAG: exopolysaccharide biosynthesis protein [Methylophaga sp.]